LGKARDEVRNYRQYDYIVRNTDLKEATRELEAIITAERLRTTRLNVAKIEEQVLREFVSQVERGPREAAGQDEREECERR
jgi:hypothetical protein